LQDFGPENSIFFGLRELLESDILGEEIHIVRWAAIYSMQKLTESLHTDQEDRYDSIPFNISLAGLRSDLVQLEHSLFVGKLIWLLRLLGPRYSVCWTNDGCERGGLTGEN
jgi:hypothetical protein